MNFKHAEAWALMNYRAQDGGDRERIWNSRDGVTFFIVRTRDGMQQLGHVDFHSDICDPAHVPDVGDLIFVDATIEDFVGGIARNLVAAFASEQGAIDQLDPRHDDGTLMTFRQLVDHEAQTELTRHGEPPPHLVVVTKERREALIESTGERVAEARSKGWPRVRGKRYA